MSRTTIAMGLLVVAAALGIGYWWGVSRTAYRDEPVATQAVPIANANDTAMTRKVLYYRHPMGLPDTSPVPKKDSMGMDYVPVYSDETPTGPGFVIPTDRLQRLGVRTVAAAPRTLSRTIRAVGTVQIDERRQTAVSPKFEGYVTRLYVATTGAPVRRGEVLLEVYSPELVSAQQEFLIARTNLSAYGGAAPEVHARLERLVNASRQRLRNWDIDARDLAAMEKGETQQNLRLRSPVSGVVIEKLARVGQRFMPGEVMYQVASLDRVWVVANVFEQDVAALATGSRARATFEAYPGRTFDGRVALVYPALQADTRTLAVRIELANPDGALKPGLYGNVEISGPTLLAPVAVPDSAVLESGTRNLVFIARGDGRFEARDVELGSRADGFVAVSKGLTAGEPVVVDGNFLIDAESNLRAGTQALGHAHGANERSDPAANASPPVSGAAPTSESHSGHGTQ